MGLIIFDVTIVVIIIVVIVTIDDAVEFVSVVVTNVVVVTDFSGCPDCRFILLALPLLEVGGESDNIL